MIRTDRDLLRQQFKYAFEAYAAEGERMKMLLLSDDLTAADREKIAEQQRRLDEAQARFNRARDAYVGLVLAEMTAPVSQSQSTEAL